MKYTNIEKHYSIKKNQLDPYNYTAALLQAGSRAGLLEPADLDRIQNEVMLILADLIIKFNKGESTSIRNETAQGILISIFYSIDACLKEFQQPEDAIEFLHTSSIKEIYCHGLDLLDACMVETQKIYQEVMDSILTVQNEAYNLTLYEDLPAFFKNYDIIFSAQNTMASFDYPLLFDNMRIQGIFYIKQYLEKLKLETLFCSHFSSQDINLLLENYGRVYRINYREALINIFEIVLTNSIFSVLSGSTGRELCISDLQYNLLTKKFAGLKEYECSIVLGSGISALAREFKIEDKKLIDYINRFHAVLLPRFISALKYGNLDNVIILDSNPQSALEVVWDEGNSLDADSFRQVVDQIMECADADAKGAIIKSKINSLTDFIDILEADCLFGNEYHELFNTLGDMELSVLARVVFAEEMRVNPDGFTLHNVGDIIPEMEWQLEYAKFLQKLPLDRLEAIDINIRSTLQMPGPWSFLE